MKNLNVFDWTALTLVVIGGLNWGLIGVFNIDLVSSVFGVMTMFTRAIYTIIGVAAIYSIFTLSTKAQ